MSTQNKRLTIIEWLDEQRATDLINIDVRHLTNTTDFLIIVTASSARHANAIAEQISAQAKQTWQQKPKITGVGDSGWVLIDFGDMIIHVMLAETRDHYQLEKLWQVTQAYRPGHHED